MSQKGATSRVIFPTSKDWPIAYTDEIEESSVGKTPTPSGVETGEVALLPESCNLDSWLVLGRNGPGAATPDMRFGGDIDGPRQWTGS